MAHRARAELDLEPRIGASAERLRRISGLGFDVRRQAAVLVRMKAAALAWALLASFGWLTVCFSAFPYTQPWGDQLGGFLRDTLIGLARGMVDAVPGLVVVALILLITRGAVGLVNGFFRNVEQGWTKVGWLDSQTARATRRLIDVVLWLFAIAVAYPHIPGSHTESFRGISLLVGVVISLGSTGVVNQVMSGFVVIYSRTAARRLGARGRSGGAREGDRHARDQAVDRAARGGRDPECPARDELDDNFTSLAGPDGPLIGTTVTIGYDAPSRQVHALLELAASRTPGIRKQPLPRVLQRGLSDFYVEYQLLAHLEPGEDRFEALSQLRANIQDAFNEQGVQIMSPHFAVQPGQAVVVPEAKWFAPPAGRAPAGP